MVISFFYLLTTSVELTFYSSTFSYQCLHAQYDDDIRAAPLFSVFQLRNGYYDIFSHEYLI